MAGPSGSPHSIRTFLSTKRYRSGWADRNPQEKRNFACFTNLSVQTFGTSRNVACGVDVLVAISIDKGVSRFTVGTIGKRFTSFAIHSTILAGFTVIILILLITTIFDTITEKGYIWILSVKIVSFHTILTLGGRITVLAVAWAAGAVIHKSWVVSRIWASGAALAV